MSELHPETARYELKPNPANPGYVIVTDLWVNQIVIELCEEHATVIGLMYMNGLRNNIHSANEFMYGHMMGMTYAMLYADRYPKVEIVHTAPGQTMLRMTQVNGVVNVFDHKKIPGAAAQAEHQIGRMDEVHPDKTRLN